MLMMVLDTLTEDDKSKAEELVQKYQGLLYSIAFKIIGSEHMAEDIVIEAWIKIFKHLDSVGEIDDKRTKGFLVTVLENTAINEYNNNKRKMNKEISVELEKTYLAVDEDIFEQMALFEFIHSLGKKYADVLILYYVHGYKLHEIGLLLGISEATASRRIKKGELLMREYYVGGNNYGK